MNLNYNSKESLTKIFRHLSWKGSEKIFFQNISDERTDEYYGVASLSSLFILSGLVEKTLNEEADSEIPVFQPTQQQPITQ